jgi:hypothetical protein
MTAAENVNLNEAHLIGVVATISMRKSKIDNGYDNGDSETDIKEGQSSVENILGSRHVHHILPVLHVLQRTYIH